MGTADFLPNDPDALGSFRKDATVRVRVTTTASDLATVRLSARYGTETAFEVTASTGCVAAVRCEEFVLDLSRVPMNAFRGPVEVTAVGEDTLGNPGTVAAPLSLPVSRWNWARRVAQNTFASLTSVPAIGAGGRLFLAVSAGTNPGVVVVNADGSPGWAQPDTFVEGVVAVGRGTGSNEYVFYQPRGGASKALNAQSGALVQPCGAGTVGTSAGGVVLLAEGSAQVAGVSLQRGITNNRASQNEPGALRCLASVGEQAGVSSPGNLVAGAGAVYFVSTSGKLRLIDVAPGISPEFGTLDAGVVGGGNGLALLTATTVAGGGAFSKLFAYAVSNSTLDSAVDAWPSGATLGPPISAPSIGVAGVYASLRSGTDAVEVVRVDKLTGALSAQSSSLVAGTVQSSFNGFGVGSPTLGEGGLMYVIDEVGALFVLPQNFTTSASPSWGVALPSVVAGNVSASPTLDCNRGVPGSETGVFYVATESGWLVSYLIDSKGLDPLAPWPKYARDARNTGNFSGPPIGCP
jgi:hypothetical protein